MRTSFSLGLILCRYIYLSCPPPPPPPLPKSVPNAKGLATHQHYINKSMEITLLYQVSHYIRAKKQRNIKSWDQQNYLVIRGFCYIRPLYNEVPLYNIWSCTSFKLSLSSSFPPIKIALPHMNPRDQFRWGGGGAEVFCPNILYSAYLKIKWFCPEYHVFLAQKCPFWKKYRGLQPLHRLIRLSL